MKNENELNNTIWENITTMPIRCATCNKYLTYNETTQKWIPCNHQ